jgi:hypothetical protein
MTVCERHPLRSRRRGRGSRAFAPSPRQQEFDAASDLSARIIKIIDLACPQLIAEPRQLHDTVNAMRRHEQSQNLYIPFARTIDPSQAALLTLIYLLAVDSETVRGAAENITSHSARSLINDARATHADVQLSDQQRQAIAAVLD